MLYDVHTADEVIVQQCFRSTKIKINFQVPQNRLGPVVSYSSNQDKYTEDVCSSVSKGQERHASHTFTQSQGVGNDREGRAEEMFHGDSNPQEEVELQHTGRIKPSMKRSIGWLMLNTERELAD